MRKTFRYRIYPTHKQTTVLERTLEGCRWLYNCLLEERITAWKTEKKSLSRYDQCTTLKNLKSDHLFLTCIYSQVLQNVSARLDLAFRSFFRRVQSGNKPGFPRFRGKERYNSFTYPQARFKIANNKVTLPKIGNVKMKLHRPMDGVVKTCTVRRMPTGKWFVSFACNIEHDPIKQTVAPGIGLDMGLESFATLSNGEQIQNPHFFRGEEKKLAKAQRKLSAQKKSSRPHRKARKVVARTHERISNKRHNFSHQESRKIVNRFNTICVEDLSINDMQKDNFRRINKSIGDVAWRQFLDLLDCKAEWAGGQVVKVNPAYTSQICSNCGNRHKLDLSDRMYHCPVCNLQLNRDVNAAINIMTLGLQSLGVSQKAVSVLTE